MGSQFNETVTKPLTFRSTLTVIGGFLVLLLAAACVPTTPAPTPTVPGPTTAVPTANARATEAAIISHVFGTMTASAPTATRPAAATATTAAAKATAAPVKPKATVKPAVVPTQAVVVPKATTDPFLAQIPAGKGGLLIVNYFGSSAFFTIAGTVYEIPGNGNALVVLDPGPYTFSVQVPGAANGAWNDTIQIVQNRYDKYQLTPR